MNADAPRILIVEDDQAQAELIVQALAEQRPSWRVEVVTQGGPALTRLEAELFDAVLMDHRLADMAGIDCLREIVARNLDVGVVFATPFGNKAMGDEAVRQGAYDTIQKSEVTYSQLGAVLHACMQVQKIKRQVRSTFGEQVRFERQAALSQLSRTVRHEINNPLAAVCAYAEMLLRDLKDQPELRRRVQQIYDEAIRIRDVVRRTEHVRDELQEYLPGMKMIRLDEPGETPPGEEGDPR